VHDALAMGLDSALVRDPMSEPVTSSNVETVVLANEALGEAVRRAQAARAPTGEPVDGDAIIRQLGCDLMGRSSDAEEGPVQSRVITAFTAAELAVRLETLAGRLEVDGAPATGRMNDAIRVVLPELSDPAVERITPNRAARDQALALISLLYDEIGNDALLEVAGVLRDGAAGTIAEAVDRV